MTRRTTRSQHPGAVLRSGRGTHGYTGGVTPDTVNDPTPVFPDRLVRVPASATTPLRTDGEDLGGSGGVTVDNQSDPPTTVTTLVAPGAVIDDGTATLITTRLLGPFHVAHDTPEIHHNGVAIVTGLPAGTSILAAQVIPTETWDNFPDQLTSFD